MASCRRCFCCCAITLVGLLAACVAYGFCKTHLEQLTVERTLGKSELADSSLYDEVHLTEDHRREYFRDGVTIVRKALRTDTLRTIRRAVDSADRDILMNKQAWMSSDALLDFFVYGNIGGMISQLFSSPNTQTETESPNVYLWQDFVQLRQPGTNGWHMDMGECIADAPPICTRLSFPRAVICVNDTSIDGTVVLNQSIYAKGIKQQQEANAFWDCNLPFRVMTRFEEAFGFPHGASLPILPGVELPPEEHATIALSLQPGDILIFSACSWHKAPSFTDYHLFLQPSFVPASLSKEEFRKHRSPILGSQGRHCDWRASPAIGHGCHPQVHPKEQRPSPGTKIQAKTERGYTLVEGVWDFWKLSRWNTARWQKEAQPSEL